MTARFLTEQPSVRISAYDGVLAALTDTAGAGRYLV